MQEYMYNENNEEIKGKNDSPLKIFFIKLSTFKDCTRRLVEPIFGY